MGKVSALIETVEKDFQKRHPGFHKSRCRGLSMLTGLMLEIRSANLMELAAALPREIVLAEDRYQYIERLLNNGAIGADEVMAPYAGEVICKLSAQGQTVILQMDQSHINDLNEVLMVSVRFGERALPILWRVRSTQGNIGFEVQEELLNAVKALIPAGVKILLAADRFYGTARLIEWCQKAGWSYRIRLKGNLTLCHEGGEITTGEVVTALPNGVENAELYGSGVRTGIGTLHEKGHKEPWIIAMDAKPNVYTVLDYGLRWGIEAMFSDFKSRGFGLMQSQIKKPERMERLILIMALALYWAVSCGMFAKAKEEGSKRGL
jgi:hypothetical protein